MTQLNRLIFCVAALPVLFVLPGLLLKIDETLCLFVIKSYITFPYVCVLIILLKFVSKQTHSNSTSSDKSLSQTPWRAVVVIVWLAVAISWYSKHMDQDYFLPDYERQALISKQKFQNTFSIVTGGNSGVGFATAQTIAESGGSVILACRRMDACNEAAAAINAQTNSNKSAISMHLDLSSFESIRNFATNVKHFMSEQQQQLKLDYLVANAGFAASPYQNITKEGFEIGFGVMHLGHFLLVHELFDPSHSTRVAIVSSAAGRAPMAKFHPSIWNEPNGEGDLRGEYIKPRKVMGVHPMYCRAKLANALMARILPTKLTPWTSCSMHVGAVATNIFNFSYFQLDWLQSAINTYTRLLYRTPEQGSRTILKCMLDENLGNGAHLDGMGLTWKDFMYLNQDLVNDKLSERLWEISEKLTR